MLLQYWGIVMTADELADNPRSRSARLRCVRKLHDRYG